MGDGSECRSPEVERAFLTDDVEKLHLVHDSHVRYQYFVAEISFF